MNPHDNLILQELNESIFQCLLPRLQLVSLEKGDILYEKGAGQQGAYFPVNAVLSLQTEMSDGFVSDVALIGNRSMTVAGVCCSGVSYDRAIVRVSGLAYRMGVQDFVASVRHDASTLMQFLGLSKQRLMQMSKSIACARHHSTDERVARYLLDLMDITDSSEINLTHQELADGIGVRRESVSLALKELEHKYVLLLDRGSVGVLDRSALMECACECYGELETFAV